MLLLEQDITEKGRVDKVMSELEFNEDEGNKDSKKYKVEVIYDGMVYTRETESYLPILYYLVL